MKKSKSSESWEEEFDQIFGSSLWQEYKSDLGKHLQYISIGEDNCSICGGENHSGESHTRTLSKQQQ